MIRDKAQNYFDNNPDLKVLFLFDAESEYRDEIEQWNETKIKVVQAEKAGFYLKYQLEYELRDEKVLLYLPFAAPTGAAKKQFILLDILIANKELRIDDVAELMESYKLLSHQKLLVKKYIKELKIQKNQRVLAKVLNPMSFNEPSLVHGLIASFLDFNQFVEKSMCLAKMFILCLTKNQGQIERFLKRVAAIKAESTIQEWIKEYFVDDVSEINSKTFKSLALMLKYNILTQHIAEPIAEDSYAQLKFKKQPQINLLNTLVLDWRQDPKLAPEISTVFNELAGDIKEETLFSIYGSDVEYGYYTEKLLIAIFRKNQKNLPFQPENILKLFQTLVHALSSAQPVYQNAFEFYNLAANFYQFYNSTGSYILDQPIDYINHYIDEYQNIDYYFRKASLLFTQLQREEIFEILDLERFWLEINQKYELFLKEMNNEWLKCLSEKHFDFRSIKVDKQYNFFNQYLENSDQKTVVIISDALRYEAAKELLGELHSDSKNQASLFCMLASVPSNTPFGMANLLPYEKMTIQSKDILIDGVSTSGIENREKILKTKDTEAKAIQFNDLVTHTQSEARALFKARLVYVYHNVIDAMGDDRKTERQTFEAVAKAIDDLKIIVKKIHSSWNVARVIITADHGFLFNQRSLQESMFEQLPNSDEAILSNNRFLIVSGTEKVDGISFPLSLSTNITTDLVVKVPKSVNRYKRQGAGVQYVHGGASLQELLVPVIVSSRKREDIVNKVGLQLLTRNLRIISGSIKIKLLQTEQISRNIKARQIIIGLYNTANELISNTTDMLLDSTSALPTERAKQVILNLTSKAGSISVCYLQIFDKTDDPEKLNPLLKEKVINESLIEPDF